MIAVGVAGAVIERNVPERSGLGPDVLRPGAHDLCGRKPDLLPDHASIGAEDAVPCAPDDAVGVGESQRRACAQIAPQPEQVVNGVMARDLIVVVHRSDVGDPHAADLAGQLGACDWRRNPARIDECVGRVELLEAFQKERPLLGKEQREPLVHRDLPDVRFHL